MANDTLPVTIHLIDPIQMSSWCRKAVHGDRAITIAQAEDPSNAMTFNCRECYKMWRGEYPNE